MSREKFRPFRHITRDTLHARLYVIILIKIFIYKIEKCTNEAYLFQLYIFNTLAVSRLQFKALFTSRNGQALFTSKQQCASGLATKYVKNTSILGKRSMLIGKNKHDATKISRWMFDAAFTLIHEAIGYWPPLAANTYVFALISIVLYWFPIFWLLLILLIYAPDTF